MLRVDFCPERGLRVLCLGAHSDDIEIGCGGTLLRVINRNKNISFYWIVFSADKKRAEEAFASANSFLAGTRDKRVEVLNYRESFFPYLGSDIKEFFERLKEKYDPNLIFTHFRQDLHQDHRLISDLTWNTFRNHLILEYEIFKYDGDLGSPNFLVPLENSICLKKIRLIREHFKSQRKRQWFSGDVFLSLLKLRGVEANSPTGYAEGFYARKILY